MGGDGLALLNLHTTRRIHSEGHRGEALVEIGEYIAWHKARMGITDEVDDPARDMPALENLLRLVEGAVIGDEWLTDAQDMRFNEELFRAGRLGLMSPN